MNECLLYYNKPWFIGRWTIQKDLGRARKTETGHPSSGSIGVLTDYSLAIRANEDKVEEQSLGSVYLSGTGAINKSARVAAKLREKGNGYGKYGNWRVCLRDHGECFGTPGGVRRGWRNVDIVIFVTLRGAYSHENRIWRCVRQPRMKFVVRLLVIIAIPMHVFFSIPIDFFPPRVKVDLVLKLTSILGLRGFVTLAHRSKKHRFTYIAVR